MAKKKEIKKIPGKTPVPIYNQILVQPLRRGINDIGSWKSALRAADIGLRSQLYDLYEEVLIDGVVTDAISKRIDSITDCDINFTINKNEVPVINELMDTIEFEEMLKEIMWSLFKGISLDEFNFTDGLQFHSIPRKHILPKKKEIILQTCDTSGISYADNDQMIQWGNADDLGLLLKVAPYMIYKRGGFGDYAQFVELFGMPQRIGKYNSMDEQSRRLLIRAFEEAGSAPYLVIPKESEVTQTTLSGSVNGALYNDFRNACNEEILITILGQTMTTKDGASLSQSKVHMEVQEKKHRSDRRFVIRMLNKYFVPLLERRGYPVHGGKFSFVDKKDEIKVDELKTLSTMVPVPHSYVYEKYGIPQPKEGEPVVSPEQPGAATGEEVKPGEKPVAKPGDAKKEEKEPVKNADHERNFFIRLWDFFVAAPRDGATGEVRMSDASLDEELIIGVSGGEIETFHSALFEFIAADLLNAIQPTFEELVKNTDTSIAYNASDDVFRTAMETNLYHFSAAKTLAEIQELNRLFRESKNFNEFHRRAKEVTNVFNKTWQKTEYDTALLSAEAASNYRRLMSKVRTFPYWEYRTAGDEKVRASHELLNGMTLHYSDARWNKLFPPNDWRCRCRVVPRMAYEVKPETLAEMKQRADDYIGAPEWKQAAAQGWGVNRGKTGEVFSANQMYIRKFPNQAARHLNQLTADKWGMESVPKQMAKAEQVIPVQAQPAPVVWEQAASEGVISLPDYRGRTIVLEKKQFDSHTTGKGSDDRIVYWDAMLETLLHPDEVWLNDDIKKNVYDTYSLLRYYQDGVIVANYRIEDDKLVLKTWYLMRTTQDPNKRIDLKKIWDKRRRGLLIKKAEK